MGLAIEEQETHISFSRNDKSVKVYTSDSVMMRRFDKILESQGNEWNLESISKSQQGEVVGKTYSCPIGLISFRSKKINRTYTDEQRKEMADRLNKNRV